MSQVKQQTVKESVWQALLWISTPVDKHIEAMICGDRCYIKRKDTKAISML